MANPTLADLAAANNSERYCHGCGETTRHYRGHCVFEGGHLAPCPVCGRPTNGGHRCSECAALPCPACGAVAGAIATHPDPCPACKALLWARADAAMEARDETRDEVDTSW